MTYIKGKIKHIIYEAESGYKVGLIRVKETDDVETEDFLNKTLTFTGYFPELLIDDNYIMYGNLVYKDKYGYQYNVNDFKRVEVTGREAIIEFLTSDLIKGCGESTAVKIVDTLGDEALKKIKEDPLVLLNVPKMTEKKATKIYNSLVAVSNTDEMLIKLKEMGFSINEALSIINKYGNNAVSITLANPYSLVELIDFDKLDNIYLKMGCPDYELRIKNCFIQVLKTLEIRQGDTYFYLEEVVAGLKSIYNINIDDDAEKYLEMLKNNNSVTVLKERIYLTTTYRMEKNIAATLEKIASLPISGFKVDDFQTEVAKLQDKINVTYDAKQLIAIKSALENRVTIITGGPGTGKTTIIKAITSLYIKMNNIKLDMIDFTIALLAPTGRAAKKLSESSGLPASTIHKYLKWNKETNEFQVNELNKNYQKLIIVDEVSMIDTNLFDALLKGINSNIQLILVGDKDQLPSVGPGLVLQDLINSDLFTFCPLTNIHRQSDNSYIPYLAEEIKEHDVLESFLTKKDDYNFLEMDSNSIRENIKKICELSINKGLTDKDIQVLAPMYKGINGIDSLNVILRDLFNPASPNKKEVKIGELTYRVGDKVLQLVNDPDNGIYNGDIGYIRSIVYTDARKKSLVINIDFDNNLVAFKTSEMIAVKHAYAISIHKAQGSEFLNVVMPISKSYYKMLYNKLIYTGVSRAKKSLILVGEAKAFLMAVNNDYSTNRKTSLKEMLEQEFLKK
ncbi:MAG: ATP-dependent RecD-like DNA helicase [bacterium]|nr:ATP-dependent RecD-like DNA helicase [bacterium]